MYADRSHAQQFLPERRQSRFDRRPRLDLFKIGSSRFVSLFGQRQGVTVDFAAERPWQPVERYERRWDHVVGQSFDEVSPQLRSQDAREFRPCWIVGIGTPDQLGA